MPNIFNYTDYRKFLGDFYLEQKAASPSFSYQKFSLQAGFSSKSFIYNVIKGTKNLSKGSAVSVSEAMKLTKTESSYFENLVSMCQAGTFKEKAFFYDQMDSIRPQNSTASSAKRLRQDQYEFFSNWYHVVIRSLIDIYPFKDDYVKLATLIRPNITTVQAKNSVRLLERLGLIEMGDDGFYKVVGNTLTTGPEVVGLAAQKFHLDTMELASRSLKETTKDQRNIFGLTLGISKKTFEKVNCIMIECQNQILQLAANDTESDAVYQLNVQFFPVSKTITLRGAQ
jgi:uncharacterized protein (TIGR02147 family)